MARRIAIAVTLLGVLTAGLAAQPNRGGSAHVTTAGVASDGTEVQIDLPVALHLRNTGGNDRTRTNPRGEPGKGSGLCVFTSLNHSAYWQNVQELQELQSWMRNHPGGAVNGHKSGLDAMIDLLCKEKGFAKPHYLQVLSNDIEILKLACATGRTPSITYSRSPTGRYGGASIAHMVTLVAAGVGKGPDGRGWWCILDNNFPGTYEWMSEADFRRSYSGGQLGWCVVLLNPGPPPPPKN